MYVPFSNMRRGAECARCVVRAECAGVQTVHVRFPNMCRGAECAYCVVPSGGGGQAYRIERHVRLVVAHVCELCLCVPALRAHVHMCFFELQDLQLYDAE